MNILLIRLSAIGDIIHSLPVPYLLKKAFPECRITWVVEPAGASLVEGNPAVDTVLVSPRKKILSKLSNPGKWAEAFKELNDFHSLLRQEEYDAAVDLQGLFKSGSLALVAKAKRKICFDESRELIDKLFKDKLDVGDYFALNRHIVEHNRAMAKYVIGLLEGDQSVCQEDLQFPLPKPPAESVQKINGLLAGILSSPQPGVVLVPGTTWSSKIWPTDKWSELGKLLINRMGANLILVGGASEEAANKVIESQLRAVAPQSNILNLTGQTSLLDLIELFSRVKLVIGGDTGPLHLAAAQGQAQIVGVYGSTPVLRNGPYGKQCQTIALSLSCQPCFQATCPLGTLACLKELSPQAVADAAVASLNQS